MTAQTGEPWPRRGVCSRGLWVTFLPPFGLEALPLARLGWLGLDLQHGDLEPADVAPLLRVAEAAGVPALVRLPSHDPAVLSRVLDAGARGVIVPQVDTVEQAEDLVRAARNPPLGRRSTGLGRTALRGFMPAEPVLLPMIESADGLTNAEQIAATPGVDGLFVGPYDLALSLARPGPTDPAVVREISAVVDVARASSRLTGAFCGDPALAVLLPEVDLLAVDADLAVLRRGFDAVFGES